MGVWDAIYYTGDLVKGAGGETYRYTSAAVGATYRYTSAAVIKIDQVVRVDGIQKLPQYFPDSEKRSQIALFATVFAKNAGKYAVYEGFKHIPGATVTSKLVKDTMREVKQVNQKDGMNAIKEKVDRLEKDLKKNSTSQPENLSKRGDLISSQNAGGGEAEKIKDIIKVFMKTEFVGSHMFNDLKVPKIARMEKKSE